MTAAIRHRPTSWILAIALLAWALLCLPPAVAQSNSLLGGGRRPAAPPPTTQPARPADAAAAAAQSLGIRNAFSDNEPLLRDNAVLLTTSPIAIELPEPEEIRVHDLVTIIVRVSKNANSQSKMKSKKDWKLESELSEWIRYSDVNGIVPAKFEFGKPSISFDWKDDYKGDGSYDRSDSLTTRIQATVIDVKPNGNVVLEARSDVDLGEDRFLMTLTGICRADDVSPQNTVLSTQIADLTVNVTELGSTRDASRRGWVKRALDLLRPF